MESIYYVVSWLCHRTCEHCYEDRFRPYYGDDLRRVIEQAEHDSPRIIANLPEAMTYHDRTDSMCEKTGRVILAGGEVLLDPIREPVLYPALDLLYRKYAGRVHLIIQTTGDVFSERILDELLARHVWMVSVSGMDDYHEGLNIVAVQAKLTRLFQSRGMKPGEAASQEPGPLYHFFGAVPGSWIGKLWPRGRAWSNQLSTADITENFCNRWSGGLKFLDYDYDGSEVSIDPEGNVYPCCVKTRLAIGNLRDEPLEPILRRCGANPVYQAISAGAPQRMGLGYGWSVEKFLEKSRVALPSGRLYENLCIGCDRFHEEVLANSLVQIGR